MWEALEGCNVGRSFFPLEEGVWERPVLSPEKIFGFFLWRFLGAILSN